MDRIFNYLRTFPDLFPKDISFFSSIDQFLTRIIAKRDRFGKVIFLYLGVLVVMLSFFLLFSYRIHTATLFEHRWAVGQLEYWEEVITAYSDFPDAYYNAAYYSARLGEEDLALQYIDYSLYLDGDFQEALALRREILAM